MLEVADSSQVAGSCVGECPLEEGPGDWDEFLPVVQLSVATGYEYPRKKNLCGYTIFENNSFQYDSAREIDSNNIRLTNDKNDEIALDIIKLSRMDKKNETYAIQEITTQAGKLTFSVDISQGHSDSKDEDGFVDITTSDSEKLKLLSSNTVKTSYGRNIIVELEIKSNKSKIFFLDFYANDDKNDEWNIGEYKDVHCGKIKIIFESSYNDCTDSDWSLLPPLVSKDNFVPYSSSSDDEIREWWPEGEIECFHYAWQQIRVLGYTLITTKWESDPLDTDDNVYDLINKDGTHNESEFVKALKYIKEAMKEMEPVFVGIDYGEGAANSDELTDHFAVIVGTGIEKKGSYKYMRYFDVCDNAFNDDTDGIWHERYYVCCNKYCLIKSDGSKLTQIRKTKKL